MSKLANMLKMIILLKSNGKMKSRELAEILEIDERMVRNYIKDLELAGVYVDSVRGVNGGYILNGYDSIINLDVKEAEFAALQLANDLLKSQDFIYCKEFDELFNKISIVAKEKGRGIIDAEQFFVKDLKTINVEDERKKALDINKAIINKKKIKMTYFSPTSGESKRIVHPYSVVTYKGALYFVAYCEKRNEVLDFKLSRIKSYEILEDNFQVSKEFSLKNYMENSIGIYKDKIIKVKLRIFKPMSYIISEKIWVENQKISWNDDESIIFEADMRGKTEIISWILSMKSQVKVLEPEGLREEIKEEVEKIKKLY